MNQLFQLMKPRLQLMYEKTFLNTHRRAFLCSEYNPSIQTAKPSIESTYPLILTLLKFYFS